MEEFELPLVFFTVLSQWAVGIVLVITLLEWIKPDYLEKQKLEIFRVPALTALPLAVIATLASMLHMGYPYKSYLTITGFQHSWLSREIIAIIILNATLAAFTWIWWKHINNSSLRKWIGTLSSVIGIATICVSAQVYYQMLIHPTWHSWTTFASFILTGGIIGAMYVYYFISRSKEEEHPLRLFAILIGGILIMMVIVLGVFSQNIFIGVEGAEAVGLTFSSSLFWIRIVFSLLVPAGLLLYLFNSKKQTNPTFALMIALLVVVGELSGRMLFYYTVVSQQPWF